MQRLHRAVLLLIGSLAVALAAGVADAAETRRVELDNGLVVILHSIASGELAALSVIYDIGELDDPPDRSGFAHLVEHVYVTAAAGEAPPQSAEAWFARYGGQANAQTGGEYTLFATVFARTDLEAELIDAAARMSDLRVTDGDLARERGRMALELRNMYGGMPALASMNTARMLVDPRPNGGRKGGVMAELETVDAAQIRAAHRRLYKPVNATLVAVGAFDCEAVERIVRERFGAIVSGETPPPRPPLPEPSLGVVREREIVPAGFAGAASGVATLAFRAPDADDDLYPAFLFLVAQLYQQEMANMRKPGAPPVSYAPLDDPRVLFVAENATRDATNDELEKTLRDRIARATTIPPGDEPDRRWLVNFFGHFLGLTRPPDAMVARNPYLPALALGRLEQLGNATADLRTRIEAVTAEDLRRCAEEVFGANRGAVAIVRPREAAGN